MRVRNAHVRARKHARARAWTPARARTLLLEMNSTFSFCSLSRLESDEMLLYEIHSSSSESATASRFSILLMQLRPSDRICRFSRPVRPVICAREGGWRSRIS